MDKYIIVSYIPFFDYESRKTQKWDVNLISEVDNPRYQVSTFGCLWASIDDKYSPIFVIDKNPKKLVEHMRFWAEGDDHFNLVAHETSDNYSMVITPDWGKSVDRFKYNHFLQEGEFLLQKEYIILFRMIAFVSTTPSTISIKSLPSEIDIGFIHKSNIDQCGVPKKDDAIHMFGAINVINDNNISLKMHNSMGHVNGDEDGEEE